MSDSVQVRTVVNGEPRVLAVPPAESLVRTLRDRLGLFSVRATCGIGVCGSCTVLLDGQPVSSCLLLAVMVEGHEIITAEGLSDRVVDSPVPDAFVDQRAYQCSFCTPAITLAVHAVLRDEPRASDETIRERLAGNLCRCGSYPQVLAAARQAAGPADAPAEPR